MPGESGAQAVGSSAPRKPRRRWRRVVLISLGAVLALLVVLVALGPTLAASFVAGRFELKDAGRTTGAAEISGVSLSWFGPQKVSGIRIVDERGQLVAEARVESTVGLFRAALGALGMGSLDLGESHITATASITRAADGTTNIQRLFPAGGAAAAGKPSPSGGGSGGATLPTNLAARLVIDSLEVTYTDEGAAARGSAASAVAVRNVRGDASFRVGAPLTASLSAEAFYGKDKSSITTPGGAISLKAAIDGLTDASGSLTPDNAKIDATLDGDVAVALADVLAGMENRLVAALGDRLTLKASVKGTGKDADADLRVSAKSLSVDAGLKYAKNGDGAWLTATRPAVIKADTTSLLPAIPGAKEALDRQDAAKFERLPSVAVSVSQLKVRVPSGGAPLDLRGSSIGAKLELGEAVGKVKVPGAGGAPDAFKECRVSPLTLTLAAPDLAQGVTLKGQTAATLGGESAGSFTVDLAASGLLDGSGAPRTMPEKAEGAVLVQGVATAIAQPFVAGAGLNLAQDIGPKADLELRARTREPAPGAAPGAMPPTDLTLRVASANVNASGKVSMDSGVIRGPGTALELTVGSAAPLAGRLLKDSGVSVASGAGAKVEVKDLTLDTARLSGPKSGPGAGKADLRAVSAVVAISTTETAGSAVFVPGEPARPFKAAPLTAMVDARDLSKGVAVKAEGSATLDGKPAGTLHVGLTASGLLDEHGAPLGVPRSIEGQGSIEGINTAALQPMVKSLGLDLPKDVGPFAAVRLKAEAVTGAAPGGGIPPTHLVLDLVSDQVTAQADLVADERSIRAKGEGFRLTAKSAGAIASRFVKPESGMTMAPGGWVSVTASGIDVPLDPETRRPLTGQAGASVAVKSGAFAFTARPVGEPGAQPQQLQFGPLDATIAMTPGAAPKIRAGAPLSADGKAGSLTADLELAGLLVADGAGGLKADPGAARPTGRVEIKNLPTALARLAPRSAMPAAAPGDPAPAPGLDIGRLASEALGPTASITVQSVKAQGDAIDLTLGVTAERATMTAGATVGSAALDLKKVDASASVTPALAAAVFDGVLPPADPKPRLQGPAQVTVSVDPVKIPLGAGLKPDFAKSGTIAARARIDGKLLVDGLTAKGAEGQPPRDFGTLGIEGIDIVVKAPLTGLAPGGGPTHAEATLKGRVLGGPAEKLAELQARVDADLAGGGLAKPAAVQAYISEINTRRVDALAGKPGFLSGAIGDTAVIDATATVQLPRPAAPGAPAPAASAPAFEKVTLKASLNAPRLAMAKPLQATLLPDRVTLDQPMAAKWTVDQAWANALIAPPPPPPGAKPEVQAAKFTSPIEVNISFTDLALATGPGPLKPGVFNAAGRVDVPVVNMTVKDGTPVEFDNLRVGFLGGHAPGVIGFDVRTEGDARQATTRGSKVLVKGGLYQVADQAGVPTPDAAYLTADGDVTDIPTVLIDTLAKQGGVLVEALGPTVTLKSKAEGVNRNQGRFAADVTAPRAKATLSGSMQTGVFVADAPIVATLSEISPTLGGMLVKGLPMVGTFYKAPEDGPTRLTLTGLQAPIDGDLRKLNGDALLEVGTARFDTSTIFSAILKVTGQKQAGEIGRHMDPLHVVARSGVLSYDRYNLPIGEFTVQTEGSIDLAGDKIDVITYIPLGAVTDEVAGALNTGLGALLSDAPIIDKMSMIPFRTRGSLAKPETKADMGLFAKSLGRDLRPDRVIEDVLGDLFNRNK